MEKELGQICTEGFSFFGRTNRLISHELKNILAIISETSGLLDELLELSAEGTEVKPAKLRSLGKSIIEEVERANTVVRCMNAFAHSVDEIVCKVDLNETLSLAIGLFRLNAASKNVRIDFTGTDSHVIESSLFFLENLLQAGLHFALSAPGPERSIEISVDSNDAEAVVTISGITPDDSISFPSGRFALLAQALAAAVSIDRSAGTFRIILPKVLAGGPIQTLLAQ